MLIRSDNDIKHLALYIKKLKKQITMVNNE